MRVRGKGKLNTAESEIGSLEGKRKKGKVAAGRNVHEGCGTNGPSLAFHPAHPLSFFGHRSPRPLLSLQRSLLLQCFHGNWGINSRAFNRVERQRLSLQGVDTSPQVSAHCLTVSEKQRASIRNYSGLCYKHPGNAY